ncbi:hypothetical protein I3843_01G176600 [Carya illinoinensis]|nr:hypothetical protein I3843_01G176600 [Carya illinoinensis]
MKETLLVKRHLKIGIPNFNLGILPVLFFPSAIFASAKFTHFIFVVFNSSHPLFDRNSTWLYWCLVEFHSSSECPCGLIGVSEVQSSLCFSERFVLFIGASSSRGEKDCCLLDWGADFVPDDVLGQKRLTEAF